LELDLEAPPRQAIRRSAFGVGIGSSATVFQKKGDGLAIYVEPEQIASR
jgi:hypothetical protein